jgi:hypothetical protein
MAITASGLFCQTFLEALTNAIALDLGAEDMKVAMFTNSITPDFTNDTAYASAPYNANEVSGTGYSAGGVALTSTTLTASSGSLVFDAADTSWTSSTISSARGALVYADALAGNDVVCLVNFGADYATSNGTFLIQWNASGIFTVDLTP